MEKWFKVTARVEDGTVHEWTCEGYLAVYRLLCEQFEFEGDSWDRIVEPEMECYLLICKHKPFIIRENVVVRDGHIPCEITIEKDDPPEYERFPAYE